MFLAEWKYVNCCCNNNWRDGLIHSKYQTKHSIIRRVLLCCVDTGNAVQTHDSYDQLWRRQQGAGQGETQQKICSNFFPLFVTHLIQTLTYLLTYIVCVVSCERSQISTRELCHQTQPSIPPQSVPEPGASNSKWMITNSYKPRQRDDQFRGGWLPETASRCDVWNAVQQIRQIPRCSAVNTSVDNDCHAICHSTRTELDSPRLRNDCAFISNRKGPRSLSQVGVGWTAWMPGCVGSELVN